MGNFHDDDYDGIVLKIPRAILLTNDLAATIATIESAFLAVDKCAMMLDHRKNLYELEYHEKKSLQKQEKREQEDEYRRKRSEQQDRWLKRLELPIESDFYKSATLDYPEVNIMGTAYRDAITKKGSLAAEVSRAFNDFIATATLVEFREFCRENGFYFTDTIITPISPIKNARLIADTYGNLAVQIACHRVQMYCRGKRKKDALYYNTPCLEYSEKLQCYFISWGGDELMPLTEINEAGTRKVALLNNYELNAYSRKFTKKQP